MVLIGICLALQAGLGRILPASVGYVDFLMLPVVRYAVRRSQRSGMVVGCASGLVQDAWFRAGVFGMSGFSKTFLGWVLGGIATRFDLNNPGSLFLCGALMSLGDNLLELGLWRLLDQVTVMPNLLQWLVEGLLTGLIVAVGSAIVDRVIGQRSRTGLARRRW
jgi:rod shape-determining protein MreD